MKFAKLMTALVINIYDVVFRIAFFRDRRTRLEAWDDYYLRIVSMAEKDADNDRHEQAAILYHAAMLIARKGLKLSLKINNLV